MILLASFNYYGPSLAVQLLTLAGFVFTLAIVWRLGRVWLGVAGGAVSAAVLIWLLVGAGTGDLTGLLQVYGSPMAGVAGGVAGGLAAAIGRLRRRKRRKESDAG